MGDVRVKRLEHLFDYGGVGHIAQIDHEVPDVSHRGAAVLKQSADVLQQASGLSAYVAYKDNLAVMVDAGSTRNEKQLPIVGKREAGGTFEGYTIFVGRIQ